MAWRTPFEVLEARALTEKIAADYVFWATELLLQHGEPPLPNATCTGAYRRPIDFVLEVEHLLRTAHCRRHAFARWRIDQPYDEDVRGRTDDDDEGFIHLPSPSPLPSTWSTEPVHPPLFPLTAVPSPVSPPPLAL